jgi:hypothetical protein
MGLPALAFAGLGLSAIGTIGSGIAQSQAASYQAQVARQNAQTARENAQYAEEAGATQTQLAGRKAAAELGAVRAGFAANNIDVNSGSALDTQVSERQAGLLSQESVANNALLQAYGYRTQATGYQAQAGLLQGQAETAIPGSILSGGGSLLSNAALLPSKFSMWGSGGVDTGPVG